jgi:hypothetical protein
LFFQRPFSVACWNFLGITWDHNIPFFETIQKAWSQCCHNFFMEVFLIAAWEIWKQKNTRIFRNTTPSFRSWKLCFIATVKLQMYRLKEEDRVLVQVVGAFPDPAQAGATCTGAGLPQLVTAPSATFSTAFHV